MTGDNLIISWLDPEPADVTAVSFFSKEADVYYEVRNIEGNKHLSSYP